MEMKKQIAMLVAIISAMAATPIAYALTATISNGSITDLGVNEVLTSFGMLLGQITFKLGNFSWVPTEIWLIPANIEPEIFKAGLTQQDVLQIPQNITFSTCRTGVYLNQTIGYGFRISNTQATTQILQNGTFCGLAYNGTYFVFAKF